MFLLFTLLALGLSSAREAENYTSVWITHASNNTLFADGMIPIKNYTSVNNTIPPIEIGFTRALSIVLPGNQSILFVVGGE
jgi:hypothetical protein